MNRSAGLLFLLAGLLAVPVGLRAAAAALPAPEASVRSGWQSAPFDLTLRAAPGATLRYTTDGSEPTASHGTVFAGAIRVETVAVLRAVAIAADGTASPTVQRTYLFLEQVVNQSATPPGFPATWGSNPNLPQGRVPADYGMDADPLRTNPRNTQSPIDPAKAQRLRDGLHDLPVLSVALDVAGLFGANGLYPRSLVKQPVLEKKAAVEMILPDGTPAFAVTAGLRIHGNASRQAEKTPKHGFKLSFKREFGEANLHYPVFEDSPAKKFDDLVLRPDFGVSWLHWSNAPGESFGSYQRDRAVRFRDAWLKDTFRAMGHAASHNRFVHLFLNGLYWGIYDLTEQPTDSFAERTFGGAKEDYDVIDQGGVAAGTAAAYRTLVGLTRLELPANYAKIQELLDVTEFIDYTLLHLFAGHQDWGFSKNWYAIRRRVDGPAGRFRFLPWDGENILLDETINRVQPGQDLGGFPGNLHAKLMANPDYRRAFAERVQLHLLTPGGALTWEANVARWKKWQAVLDRPIVAESARWGDYRRDVHRALTGSFALYTREDQWLAENKRIVDSYFVHRGDIVLAQLRTAGLYPAAGR
jgi:hypothetical protein